MSKIGTAHVEVKPVPNLEAWEAVCSQIEDRVADAVKRGIVRGLAPLSLSESGTTEVISFEYDPAGQVARQTTTRTVG